MISRVGGMGTFIEFDIPTEKMRKDPISRMFHKGVLFGGCGVSSVRMRTALIFDQKECEIFLETLKHCL